MREDITSRAEERDRVWMQAALDEARCALDQGDVPIGAVVVLSDRIIGRGRNQVEEMGDPTAHAEIIAIGAASRSLRVPRLTGGTIYITMEPCAMCAGAIVLARLQRIVYGCPDAKAGYCGSLGSIPEDPRLNHRVTVTSGVMGEECAALLSGFFEKLRSDRRG
ncbi:tRNA adenosine(34) deaminase TadA [bacterium]|nr:tRNA adenosine(34) deaminase TadA [bacterium]